MCIVFRRGKVRSIERVVVMVGCFRVLGLRWGVSFLLLAEGVMGTGRRGTRVVARLLPLQSLNSPMMNPIFEMHSCMGCALSLVK